MTGELAKKIAAEVAARHNQFHGTVYAFGDDVGEKHVAFLHLPQHTATSPSPRLNPIEVRTFLWENRKAVEAIGGEAVIWTSTDGEETMMALGQALTAKRKEHLEAIQAGEGGEEIFILELPHGTPSE